MKSRIIWKRPARDARVRPGRKIRSRPSGNAGARAASIATEAGLQW